MQLHFRDFARGHVGGDFDDFEDAAHLILHRRIDRLDPDFLAVFRDPLEDIVLALAPGQLRPKQRVGVRVGVGGFDKHPVMVADDLLALVTKRGEEVLVRVQDNAFGVELDVGVAAVDRGQDPLGILPLDFRHRDVVAHADVFPGLPVLAEDRRDDGIDVIGRAVFRTVLDDPAEGFAATDGGPEFFEDLLGHVGMPGRVVRFPDQLFAAVFGHLDELLVDVEDVSLEIGFGNDAGEIGDLRTHPQFRDFFRQLVLLGAVGGQFHDFHRQALRIKDRAVRRLNPDFLSALGQALEFTCGHVPFRQIVQKCFVVRAGRGGRFDEDAVRFLLNVRQAVAEDLEKLLAGREDGAIERKLDDRLRFFDRLDFRAQALELVIRRIALGRQGAFGLGWLAVISQAVGPRGGCWINHGFWF